MMKSRGWAGALAMISTLSCVDPVIAATFKNITSKDGHVIVLISGEIAQGDADLLKAAIKNANDAGKYVSGVRLNSIGGNLLEGVKLADAVRFAKIATNVAQGATCASACFLVFAAGDTKFANYGAQVGVHGASDETGSETVQSGAATVSMARVAKELGVPPAIIGRMVVTRPSEMVWLNPHDLASMGTTMVGKPAQVPITTAGGAAPNQTTPSGPLQLQPQQQAKVSEPPTWSNLVAGAIRASSDQNGGAPKMTRNCQPEARVCNNAVIFKGKDGTDSAVLTREDLDGKISEREFCTFNSFGDVRSCLNWDTAQTHRDMKNSKGEWYRVSD
jgi:hypothetical protein